MASTSAGTHRGVIQSAIRQFLRPTPEDLRQLRKAGRNPADTQDVRVTATIRPAHSKSRTSRDVALEQSWGRKPGIQKASRRYSVDDIRGVEIKKSSEANLLAKNTKQRYARPPTHAPTGTLTFRGGRGARQQPVSNLPGHRKYVSQHNASTLAHKTAAAEEDKAVRVRRHNNTANQKTAPAFGRQPEPNAATLPGEHAHGL